MALGVLVYMSVPWRSPASAASSCHFQEFFGNALGGLIWAVSEAALTFKNWNSICDGLQ